ncbi:two-component system sensor histidine kinase YesM [Hydrogenispora ethanolica]|uniref:histidine kinase n=1 Tax=Hydrogenispora ethanolica TaxID=1082276 RepID=A0A4R1R7K7_HYDET|nr:sensor histidine kinase [Hydrogenispora ethanolica]TCL61489.1 two-component system sensor histidine kinase YesM [Hydrogenispora ethanolica]
MTIQKKLLFSIICFVIIPMFLLPFITYNSYRKIIEAKINVSTQQTLAQIDNNLGAVFDNMIAASNMLSLDRELIDILKGRKYDSRWEKFSAESKIEEKILIAKNANLYPYNADIVILDFHGNVYSASSYYTGKSYREIAAQDWFRRAREMNGYMLWMAPSGSYVSLNGDDRRNIAMARLIKDSRSGRGYGILLISLYPEMKLAAIFKTEQQLEGTQLFLLNRQAQVVLAGDPGLLGKDLAAEPFVKRLGQAADGSFVFAAGRRKTVVNYRTVPKTNWTIVQQVPYRVLMKEVDRLRSYHLTINLIFLGALLIVSAFISWTITHPLHRLSLLMQQVPKGNFAVRADIRGRDEVAQLGASFNVMVQEIAVLIQKLQEAQAMREQARLEALQAQINPHFLFNTLNDIKWLATLNGAANVSQMIAALGKLLETTVGRSDALIPLSEEIQCIESYVLLQKMRYGNKFEIRYEIAPPLLDYRVPQLVLQPLVENAIIHGFEDMDSGGEITITGYCREDRTYIDVTDNGKGIAAAKIEQLLEAENRQKGRFNNVGLRNVNERIALYFGKRYGLTVASREGSGTRIRLCLPAVEEETACSS